MIPKFPTMLRKMWSGGEVQEWIDRNIEPVFNEFEVVGYISPWSVKRVAANNGVLSMCAFPENISNQPNDCQTLPIYIRRTK